jgi:protein-S-isoprenylcysteine O-methyltransferase Ste14
MVAPDAGRAAATLAPAARQGQTGNTAEPALRSPWRSSVLRWRPPRIAAWLLVAGLALHALVVGTGAAALPFGRAPFVGLTLAAAGFLWMLWAWQRFRAVATPIAPTAKPRVLVDDGPFALGRQPMYLGITAQLLGVAIALGSPFVAAAAAAFVAIVGAVHVPHEEAELKRAFGGWYSDYAARVRRWI